MSEPIHILSLGAGVQSSTLALMAAHGEITPMPKCAIFADTQDEPKSVYTWLDWLEKQLPFPVHRVTQGSLSKEALKLRKGIKFPLYSRVGVPAYVLNADGTKGKLPRHCTRDFKVAPLTREQKRVAGIKRNNGKSVVVWIGISLDEVHRMKPSRESWATHRWPLVDARMTRWKCLQWMESKGFPTPPRSACVYCPYHSDKEWRRLRDEEPKEFAKAVKFEVEYQEVKRVTRMVDAMPFLHNSCVPLDQVDFSTDEDHGQQVMFGNECEGMCGV